MTNMTLYDSIKEGSSAEVFQRLLEEFRQGTILSHPEGCILESTPLVDLVEMAFIHKRLELVDILFDESMTSDSILCELFYQCIFQDDYDILVPKFLELGFDPLEPNDDSSSPFILLVKNNEIELVSTIINDCLTSEYYEKAHEQIQDLLHQVSEEMSFVLGRLSS